jgi:hypothetical protein
VVFSERYLACGTYHPENKYYLGLNSWEFENSDREQLSSLVQGGVEEVFMPYGKRKLSFSGPNFTLVPKRFLENELLTENYYHINYPRSENEMILKEFITELGSWIIYGIPQDFYTLKEVFQPEIFTFTAAGIIKAFDKNPLTKESLGVFIDLDYEFCIISVYQQSLLQLCNSFRFHSPEDILYYVMNVTKHFGLDPDQKKIYFSGFIESRTDLHKLLYKYIRFPVFLPVSPVFKLDPCFNEIPVHYYNNLFNLALCE